MIKCARVERAERRNGILYTYIHVICNGRALTTIAATHDAAAHSARTAQYSFNDYADVLGCTLARANLRALHQFQWIGAIVYGPQYTISSCSVCLLCEMHRGLLDDL